MKRKQFKASKFIPSFLTYEVRKCFPWSDFLENKPIGFIFDIQKCKVKEKAGLLTRWME